MPEFLKGNYSLPEIEPEKTSDDEKGAGNQNSAYQEEFEAQALSRLGGSIAFIAKSTFVWDGDDDGKSR